MKYIHTAKTGRWEGLETRLTKKRGALPTVKSLGNSISYIENYGVLSLGGADNALDVDGMQYHHRFAAIS